MPIKARRQGTSSITYWVLKDSFARSLKAQNLSPRTIESYLQAVQLFGEFLQSTGMSMDPAALTREHIETWMIHLRDTPHQRTGKPITPGTMSNRYRSIQQLFKWLMDEDEIQRNPMEKMKPPKIPEAPPPVLEIDQLKALVESCEADKSFYGRRDAAIIRLLIDTGLRRSELTGLRLDDVDFVTNRVWVTGKGNKRREVPFGRKTAKTLDRYLRARSAYANSDLSNLWLGSMGPMTHWGIADVVRNRTKAIGLPDIHPYLPTYLCPPVFA